MLDLSNERTDTRLSDVKQGQFFCFCVDDPELADMPRHEYTHNAGKPVDASSIYMMIGIPGYLKVKCVNGPDQHNPISKEEFKHHMMYINIHTANMHHCYDSEYVYVVKGIDFSMSV